MKRIFLVLLVALTVNGSFAAFSVTKPAESTAAETKEQHERAVMEMIAGMPASEYESLTGKKMNFIERFTFKLEKKRIEKQLKKGERAKGFNLGGFFLGFFLGPIGILAAYLVSHNPKVRRSAWIGFSVLIMLLLIFGLIFAARGGKWN